MSRLHRELRASQRGEKKKIKAGRAFSGSPIHWAPAEGSGDALEIQSCVRNSRYQWLRVGHGMEFSTAVMAGAVGGGNLLLLIPNPKKQGPPDRWLSQGCSAGNRQSRPKPRSLSHTRIGGECCSVPRVRPC